MANHYRFTARDWEGNKIRAEIFAASPAEAFEIVQGRNLVLLDLKKISPFRLALKKKVFKALHIFGYRSYTSRDLMIFCRQLATMLQAGIAILQCLRILSGQKEIASLQKQIEKAALEVERGESLSTALQGEGNNFPPIMISMVKAGEASGRLDVIMEKTADHFEKQHDFAEKIRSAALYPAFIILVSLAVLVVMVVFVLPQFAGIFEAMGMEMPLHTRLLLVFAAFFSRNLLLLTAAFIFTVTGVLHISKTEKGRRKIDRLRLQLPFIGKIYIQTIAARFSRAMSALLASGIGLHSALKLTDQVLGNMVLSSAMANMGEALNQGESLAGAMQKEKYFPTLLTEMVRVGEETGALEHTLDSTALYYEKEVAYVIDRLGTILEPALLLIVGSFIGLLVFSMLAPMYQVYEMI